MIQYVGYILLALIIFTAIYAIVSRAWLQLFVVCLLFICFQLTRILYHSGGSDWLSAEWSIFVLDLSATIVFASIAMLSRSYWMIHIAALHGLATLIFLVSLTPSSISSLGQGFSQGIWGWLQFIVIIISIAQQRKQSAAQ